MWQTENGLRRYTLITFLSPLRSPFQAVSILLSRCGFGRDSRSRNSVSLAPVSSRPTSSSAILKCSAVFSKDLKQSACSCPGAPCGYPWQWEEYLKRYITEHNTSIHTCTHARTHARMHIRIHIIIYGHKYGCMHTCICTHTHAHAHTNAHARTHTRTHTHRHIKTCTCIIIIHARTHTCMHAHSHARTHKHAHT